MKQQQLAVIERVCPPLEIIEEAIAASVTLRVGQQHPLIASKQPIIEVYGRFCL